MNEDWEICEKCSEEPMACTSPRNMNNVIHIVEDIPDNCQYKEKVIEFMEE